MQCRFQLIIRPTHEEITYVEYDGSRNRRSGNEYVFVMLPSAPCAEAIQPKPGERNLLDLQPLNHLHRLEIGKYKLKNPAISTSRMFYQEMGYTV